MALTKEQASDLQSLIMLDQRMALALLDAQNAKIESGRKLESFIYKLTTDPPAPRDSVKEKADG